LDEGVRVINTLCEKIITLDFVSGDNFPPRVLIYPNTFIQGMFILMIVDFIITIIKWGLILYIFDIFIFINLVL
jgi:hypothetical protein